jgi:hypothetical protein
MAAVREGKETRVCGGCSAGDLRERGKEQVVVRCGPGSHGDGDRHEGFTPLS